MNKLLEQQNSFVCVSDFFNTCAVPTDTCIIVISFYAAESAEFNGKAYTIAAEVGLLTRNIVIEGNDYDLLFDESFGARTIVGSFIQDGEFYRGILRFYLLRVTRFMCEKENDQ